MRRLYTYVPLENTVMQKGLMSPVLLDKELLKYGRRAGSEDKEKIAAWLDSTFEGRSRSVSCLTEPVHRQGNDVMLKDFVSSRVLFSYDVDRLVKDSVVERIYCKDGSGPGGFNETFVEVSLEEIDFAPLPWEKCSREKGLFFGVIRHYMLVLRDGLIPPEYLCAERIR